MIPRFTSVAIGHLLLSCASAVAGAEQATSSAAAVADGSHDIHHAPSFLSNNNAEQLERYLKKHDNKKKQDQKKQVKNDAEDSVEVVDDAEAFVNADADPDDVEVTEPTPAVIAPIEEPNAAQDDSSPSAADNNDRFQARKKKNMRNHNGKNKRYGKGGKYTKTPTPMPSSTGHPTTKAPSTAKPTTMKPTNKPTSKGSSKSGKAGIVTHKPTTSPSLEPTDSPTQGFFPPNAQWVESFEKATFPNDPEWSVDTTEYEVDYDEADDLEGRRVRKLQQQVHQQLAQQAVHGRRLEQQEEEEMSLPTWELTMEEAQTGKYSIKTPSLDNEMGNIRVANVTLTTDPSWGQGWYIAFSFISTLNDAAGVVNIYVDGEWQSYAYYTFGEWQEGYVMLAEADPGVSHEVTWEYTFNPEYYDPSVMPEGAVFIDDLYFVPVESYAPTASMWPTWAPYPTPKPTPYPTWPPYSYTPTVSNHPTSEPPAYQPTPPPSNSPEYPPTPFPITVKPTTSPTPEPDCPAMPGNCEPGGCDGVCKNSEGTIGNESCLGTEEDDETCLKLDGNVGNSSCWGVQACKRLKGNVGNGSCQSDESCRNSDGDIHDSSCKGSGSCKDNDEEIGSFSCWGENSCTENEGMIGNGTCIGRYTCAENSGESIGHGSCTYLGDDVEDPKGSCTFNEGKIGSGSCNGLMACYGNTGTIGDNACNGPMACVNNTVVIGDGSCNGIEACRPLNDGRNMIFEIGDNACLGNYACAENIANISMHGCMGDYACHENTGNIGFKSCDGLKSCHDNSGPVGRMLFSTENVDTLPDGSCKSEAKDKDDVEDVELYSGACQRNTAEINDRSCWGDGGCFENSANVGSDSCQGSHACRENGGEVGNGSCQGSAACKNSTAPIGSQSCTSIGTLDDSMCENQSGGIGDGSCLGQRACKDSSAEIGSESCLAAFACCGNTNEIEDGTCLGSRDGCNQCPLAAELP